MEPKFSLLMRQICGLVMRFIRIKQRRYIMTGLYDIGYPVGLTALLVYLMSVYSSKKSAGPDRQNADGIVLVTFMPLIIYLLYFRHFCTSIGLLVQDRSTGFKALMTTMGLRKSSYYLANITTTMLMFSLPICLIIASVSTIYLTSPDLTATPILVIFVVFCFQTSATIFAFGSIISSPSVSYIVTFLFWSLQPFVYVAVANMAPTSNDLLQALMHFAVVLMPQQGLSLFLIGIVPPTSIQPQPPTSPGPSSEFVLVSMLVWTVLLFAFSWYFDAVCPWKPHEAPKSPLYCMETRESRLWNPDNPIFPAPILDPFTEHDSRYFESPPRDLPLGIYVDSVTKKFSGPDLAVNNVSFSIYRGQTTLLLGHNGAGKTTLMKMIIGQLNPNYGKVYINGYSIRTCAELASSSLGLCPQDSILSDDLTVRQHLNLFSDLKGYPKGNAKRQHVNKILHDVGLFEDQHKVISELSGGMKRKLSLGLAFVGDSNILILDEPSSGLDPESRKFVWDAIRRYRSQRTVLLSTQHMEEADYLGDRVCIMSKGQIACCGSALFLKKVLGSPYKLRVECLNQKAQSRTLEMVRRYFPRASILDQNEIESSMSDNHGDVTIELKKSDATSLQNDNLEEELIGLFEDLEVNYQSYGIRSVGLKGSTVEDVLLNLSSIADHQCVVNLRGHQSDEANPLLGKINKLAISSSSSAIRQNQLVSECCHLFKAYTIKHLQSHKRRIVSNLFWQLLIPAWMIYAMCSALESVDNPFSGANLSYGNGWQIYPTMIVSFFVFQPTEERSTKFKLMQLTTRSSILLYWISQFISDALKMTVYSLIICSMLKLYFSNLAVLMFGPSYVIITLIFLLTLFFGLASALLAYILSHVFDRPTSAISGYSLIMSAGLFIQLFLTFVPLITDNVAARNFATNTVPKILTHCVPTDTLITALISMVRAGADMRSNCQLNPNNAACVPGSLNVLEWHCGVSERLCALVMQIVVFTTLLTLIESFNLKPSEMFNFSSYFVPKYPSFKAHADSDVEQEDHRARQTATLATSSLIPLDLTKSYSRKSRAVDGITFAVNKRECFGLLGINGAGKSTTFGILTGDVRPDYGRAIFPDQDEPMHNIGYDPQHNPLFDLSAVEVLKFMGRLRGFTNERQLSEAVDACIEIVGMNAHRHKILRTLSGGTKRKLSMVMSLIGSPPILLLDEPTAGIDPMTRREIWYLLSTLRSIHNSSVIISSHAMEECEAICDRITIMVRGRLRCLGTFQHLRSKFGRGYVLRVQVSQNSTINDSLRTLEYDTFEQLTRLLSDKLNTKLEVDDRNVNGIVYKIGDANIKRSHIFKVMSELKTTLNLDAYSLSDQTLEDLFVQLAKEARHQV